RGRLNQSLALSAARFTCRSKDRRRLAEFLGGQGLPCCRGDGTSGVSQLRKQDRVGGPIWLRVESRCGAGSLGRSYLFPPLSSGGALVVRPWLRFHIPLIEPDMQISRFRLSDKTSRVHPRHVTSPRGQAYEPEVPVKVREWISPALASPDFVLEAQPPAQPHSGVAVDRPIRLGDGAYLKVVRPSAQRAVHLLHQLCGLLPCSGPSCQLMDGFHHALDAFLRWPEAEVGFS